MKFSPHPQPPAFTPVQMLLESPEEVAAIFAVLNHIPIASTLGIHAMRNGPWEHLKNANAEAGNPRIDYLPYHEALQKLLRQTEGEPLG